MYYYWQPKPDSEKLWDRYASNADDDDVKAWNGTLNHRDQLKRPPQSWTGTKMKDMANLIDQDEIVPVLVSYPPTATPSSQGHNYQPIQPTIALGHNFGSAVMPESYHTPHQIAADGALNDYLNLLQQGQSSTHPQPPFPSGMPINAPGSSEDHHHYMAWFPFYRNGGVDN
ncbi:hypothetical protein TWF696_009650 [Orbilia brochopaga]|uniref:Uncharacterized protein n=1 Tax=Orbilia brochopaga TaxID=3140254 RepID=A0AAV9UFJ4_9PEZI